MKCVVINLPRAEARRRVMTEQFERLGLDFEFLIGTDWRELTAEDWSVVDRIAREREGRRPLSPGMIGCHLSHRRAMEAIASGEEEWTAVFEDDVTLLPDLGAALRAIQNSGTARNCDIIFLHRNRKKRPFVLLAAIDGSWRLGMIKFVDWGTQAYVVSREGARRLLNRCPKIVHRTDHTLHAYWENGLNVVSLDPPVALHGIDGGEQSLLQEGMGNRPIRPILSAPRRLYSIATEEFLKRRSFYRRAHSSGRS